MKFTLSWLKEHLETTASLQEITDRLTAIGLELEEVVDRSEKLAPFLIGHVKSAKKHPNADKLQVCQVDTGSATVQVVCGASNARAGMRGVFAPAGSYVPGIDMMLKPGVIRGQSSDGMLCSERELQLSNSHDGIIELPAEAPIGKSYVEWAGLYDPVIEINLTPNRGDCAGVRGIARDLAAAGLGHLKPNRDRYVGGTGKSPVRVSIDCDSRLCPVFAYRIIRGVKNGPSPEWVQKKLMAIDQRPISALVDVTNVMTQDQCRPMHVFDLAKIDGDLTVRLAKPGEKLLALNGREYELDASMVVIADTSGPLSLAGIMGGETTGCTESTTDVIVESAIWDPSNIARTGRRLDLHSDARFRFERGTDGAAVVEGMEIATRYLLDFCGGEPGEIQIAGTVPEATQVERFRPAQVRIRSGIEIDESKSLQILADLGFTPAAPAKNGEYAMRVPSWRSDIQGEADFVEEIGRIHGYESIPTVSLDRTGPLPPLAFEPLAQKKRRVRRALAATGILEAVTWSFLNSEDARLFGELSDRLFLENPMSAELNYMRSSLLTNLITAAGRNADRGFADVGLFEVGTIFRGVAPEEQLQAAAAVRTGKFGDRHWKSPSRSVDAFDAKQDAIVALQAAGAPVDNLRVEPDAPPYFHPGRSGALVLGRNVLAHFGEIHPRTLKALQVKGPMSGMEMYFTKLPPVKKKPTAARASLKLFPFHPIERDFAFIVDRDVTAESVLRAARSAEKKLIAGVALFDVYEGTGVAEGKKSLAISATLQPHEKSLTDAEIESICEKIVQQVGKATGGTLRN